MTVTLSMCDHAAVDEANRTKYYSRRFQSIRRGGRGSVRVEDDKPQVIIVGFGRFGQVRIGRPLMAVNKNAALRLLERDISAGQSDAPTMAIRYRFGDADAAGAPALGRSRRGRSRSSATCNEPEDTMKAGRDVPVNTFHIFIFWRERGRRVEERTNCCRRGSGAVFCGKPSPARQLELGRKALISLRLAHPHLAQCRAAASFGVLISANVA